MKKIFSGATVAFWLFYGQQFCLARGRGENNYGRQLTGKTVEMSGTIQAIDFTPPQIEIKVDADGKVIEVELGPVKQYDPKDFQIGAAISLTGEFVAENVFLPYSFKVNNKTYELEMLMGIPSGQAEKMIIVIEETKMTIGIVGNDAVVIEMETVEA